MIWVCAGSLVAVLGCAVLVGGSVSKLVQVTDLCRGARLQGRILPLMLLGLLALSTVPLYFYFRKRGLPGRNILARRGIVANAPAQHRVPVVAQQAVPAGVAQPVGYTSVSQVRTTRKQQSPIRTPD